MKYFAVVDNDNKDKDLLLIQDSMLDEMEDGGCSFGIYEDLDSAKVAADFYTKKDQIESGLQIPLSVVEVEITFGAVLYSSKFEEGK